MVVVVLVVCVWGGGGGLQGSWSLLVNVTPCARGVHPGHASKGASTGVEVAPANLGCRKQTIKMVLNTGGVSQCGNAFSNLV